MKNKICILTSAHPPFDARIFHKQGKTLVKEGFDVTLIVQHNKNEVVEGIKIKPLNKPKNRLERMIGLTFKVFTLAVKEKANAYHFHDPELLLIGILLKIFTKSKVIYDVHEDYPQSIKTKYWIPKFARNTASALTSFVEKLLSRYMDAIITVTDTIEKRFKTNRTVQVRNYPILNVKTIAVTREKENSKIRLVYIGGISKDRGIIEMIKAIELVNQNIKIELVLLGKFMNKQTEIDVKQLEGYKKVIYKGFVSREEVYENLMNADIGLVCLKNNGRYEVSLPVKLFEYMLAELPVISSNFELWKEFVEENNCGIMVDPSKPKQIAEAIEELAQDEEVRKQMGSNGKSAIIKKYNWNQEGKKLIRLYKELCNNK